MLFQVGVHPFCPPGAANSVYFCPDQSTPSCEFTPQRFLLASTPVKPCPLQSGKVSNLHSDLCERDALPTELYPPESDEALISKQTRRRQADSLRWLSVVGSLAGTAARIPNFLFAFASRSIPQSETSVVSEVSVSTSVASRHSPASIELPHHSQSLRRLQAAQTTLVNSRFL